MKFNNHSIISTFTYDNLVVRINDNGNVTVQTPLFNPRRGVRIHRKFNIIHSHRELFSGAQCEFFQFMQDCSGSTEGYARMMLALGYLLTQRRDLLSPRGFICVNHPDNDAPFASGTGKSLFCRAITEMSMGYPVFFTENLIRDGIYIGIDPAYSPLVGDLADPSILPTLGKAFVDGMQFPAIGRPDRVVLDKYEAPRMLLSTNLEWSEIRLMEGASRFIPLFFTDFYSPSLTPVDRFHHSLFDEWDEEEWNRFDNLMIFCIAFHARCYKLVGTDILNHPAPLIDYILKGLSYD